jgi:hypothetical protein
MAAVFSLERLLVSQPQVDFMNKRSRLESVPWPFLPQVAVR